MLYKVFSSFKSSGCAILTTVQHNDIDSAVQNISIASVLNESMNKCLVDGRDTQNDLCYHCKKFFEKRYQTDPESLEKILVFFRKNPFWGRYKE